MNHIKVGLVQINNSFSGQNYFPYSVGLLQAYVQKHAQTPELYDFILPIYSRLPVEEAVQQLLGADIIGFSVYVWNIRISLAIAERVKELSPETLIVFGGPQVPDLAEAFLRQNPFIDIACHGEGERTFLTVLENYTTQPWTKIPGISYLAKNGAFVFQPKTSRITDMAEIPSPYLTGVFDPLMKTYPEEQWLVMWETNRGCPFSCTFCDWGSATASKVYKFDMDRLLSEIDWVASHNIEFIFCCDANFGILPRDLEIAKYAAEVKQKMGYPQALSVQNTKNATERAYAVQKLLADSGLNKGVTISLQSVDAGTLKNIKRDNISSESFQELQRRFTRDSIETYSDMILGLPGETYDSFVDGIAQVIQNGQHNRIQFNNLAILPNAEMGNVEYQKAYGMVGIQTKIINIHGALESKQEIYETQELVIATNTMPRQDWVKTRAFCWMTAFLHFDKVLQIPLILLHEIYSIDYRDLLEVFSEGDFTPYPVLAEVRSFFIEKAEDIQNGGPEYTLSKDWLPIWWPMDEYIFIKLSIDDKLDAFYNEVEMVLSRFFQNKLINLPPHWLHEAIMLNKSLLKQPFQTDDIYLNLSYNIWEFYQAVLNGKNIPLEQTTSTYFVDRTTVTWSSWDEWCQQVIWYGNKKGAYLYSNQVVEPQLAGHY